MLNTLKMKNRSKLFLSMFLSSLLLVTSCADLDVKNYNNPDTPRVLSNPDEYVGVIAGGFISFWQMQTRAEPGCVLYTIADMATCSWGNFGMNFYSSEPRVSFDNTSTSAFSAVGERAWNLGYSGLGTVNDIMLLTSDPSVIVINEEITKAVRAAGYFLQGTIHGHLALLYDRTYYMVDETIPPGDLPNIPYPVAPNYNEAVAKAIEKLEACIAICEANEFTLPSEFMRGVGYDQDQFAKLAHTYIARFLAYKARTAAENTATNWAAVEEHARKGIDFDFVVSGDGQFWYNEATVYLSYPGWGRVDQRLVNLVDPSQPARYPLDGTVTLPPVGAVDNRFSTSLANNPGKDFGYIEGQAFIAARGLYHYSNYRYQRYEDQHGFAGPMYLIRKAENDLLLAEAIVRQAGPTSEAATLINNTHVTRGGKTALTGGETTQQMLDAIFYERQIELFLTATITGYADMRRRDLLQSGTWNQLPVPGSELELLGIPLYTYP
jgi:starch-binding outer membrane protein, SusD/RagB family